MPRNEASWDRMIRVAVGIGLLSLVFVGPQTLWGILGLVPLLTGLLGYCPLYQVAGLRTCPVAKR
jgi:hypothetical protein